MSELLDFYQQQAKRQVSTMPWLSELQKQALADFTRMGFPSRQDEDWKYTRMDAFYQQRFSGDFDSVASVVEDVCPIDTSFHVSIVNGAVNGLEALSQRLPEGVLILPLAEALLQHPDRVKPYLNHIIQQQHGFQALNTAMLRGGLWVYVPKGVVLEEPLLVSHAQTNPEQAVYLRHLVVAEEGSAVTMVEDYAGVSKTSYFTNSITEISLAANALVTHYRVQRESGQAFHIGHVAVSQAANSHFASHSFCLGGRIVRSDTTINLLESGARCLMNGIYAPGDGQHVDHHTIVKHEVPDCYSEQDYKGILKGHSRAVFNGQIVVSENAQHTVAKQQNKNLLLSASAEVDTKPQLNIMADDVACTHGATVGQLDEDALFYLAARGIDREQAKRYLVQAFATENVQLVGLIKLREWLGTLLGHSH